jgi:hypothetical protein
MDPSQILFYSRAEFKNKKKTKKTKKPEKKERQSCIKRLIFSGLLLRPKSNGINYLINGVKS